MKMRLMLVLELDAADEAAAQDKLDAFREAVLPEFEYGLTIYRATQEDVKESGLLDDVPRLGPAREAFIRPWRGTPDGGEKPSTRAIEMRLIWVNGDDGADWFVHIPADTPADQVEQVAVAKMNADLEVLRAKGLLEDSVSSVQVYATHDEDYDADDHLAEDD
jgi:hypothetical protein